MDLGYGAKNQVLGNAVSSALLQQTLAQESAINTEIAQYDSLLNDAGDAELEALRARRLAAMKKGSEQRAKWKAAGHGSYEPIGEGQHGGDVAKAFFEASKNSDRMIVHFHRPATRSCDVFHKHLEKLAPRHLETRFVKINVDGCDTDGGSAGGATFLVEKLGVVVMPTLLIVKDRKAHHHIRGFDELGGVEEFSTEALEFVLGAHGGLNMREDAEPPKELLEARGVNDMRIRMLGGGASRGAYGKSEDFDEE